ncbi:hypothetical protein ETR37_10975 [Geobacillus sp. PK12]|nr:hypothetical protein ETR37_10975 [Geobacillus sp. PK12]
MILRSKDKEIWWWKPLFMRDGFVGVLMSSNGFRNLVIKLLKEYNLKISDYKIYLRADYSEWNQ